ncbi:DUF262 domain-containing protein [Prolixibacteraceae bacterium JC049]|nr:DUF262 domain-containing protein [Prolixibacteraceae bacterium JC049]
MTNRKNTLTVSEIKSKLTLKPINDLLGDKFFIPAYQRGYRWTKRQVEELLNDIWDFRDSSQEGPKEAFYCLQPVVVSKNNGSWELVDGQQRLTTINLILEYLKGVLEILGKEKYTIYYETRPDSYEFLQNIDLSRKDENIDYYHICTAYETIDNWFKSKDGNAKINFLNTLLNDDESGKNVKVIWYDLTDENSQEDYAIDVFTRINIGKIPLTNAELIKALFLGKVKSNNGNEERVYLKRLQIANEWDLIEYTLQKNNFWHFIHEGSKNYDTRIEYIFDLMKKKPKDAEPYFTFHAFNEDFGEKEIDDIWLDIKKYFQTFQDWFNNREFYHYIGYLIATSTPITELINNSANKSKTQFREYLIEEIAKGLSYDIDDLEYGNKSMKHIRPMLLLFNIQTLLNNPVANSYFPFDLYKTENWDIEHIRSVQSEKPVGGKQRNWLEVVLVYFTGIDDIELTESQEKAIEKLDAEEKDIAESIWNLLQTKKISDEGFTKVYDKVLIYFEEDSVPDTINSISNLTLLDAKTNRSYKNAPFPVKRKTILEKDTTGTFIPLGTKNVFLKAYSTKHSNLMYWQAEDEKNYMEALKNTLSVFTQTSKEQQNDQ